jgi:hypothetical protein
LGVIIVSHNFLYAWCVRMSNVECV